MIFLERKHIDDQRWNALIAKHQLENIFCYTWYLDAVCENWGALVDQTEFECILPVPYTVKLGVKQFYTAPYTREYDIFGSAFTWKEILPELTKKFALLSFRTETALPIEEVATRKHQFIELNEERETNYRTNAKRLIKKGKQFTPEISQTPTELLALVKEHVAPKVDGMDEVQLQKLGQLMEVALKNDCGEVIEMRDSENHVVAAGFFLRDKSRITYLKGAATEEGKKKGAMFALFDFAFDRYSNDYTYFDFGGSDVEQVATFYKKFGALDRSYYHYTIDRRPIWFKTLKRLVQ